LSYTIIQISDCHLGEQFGDQLLGLDCDQSLSWVLDLINQRFDHFDALLCTGDLSNEAGQSAFVRLKQQLLNLNCQAPTYWLPGNHDENRLLQAESKTGAEDVNAPIFLGEFDLGSWTLSLFDSSIPGKVKGHVGDPELARMQQVAIQKPEQNHLFFMHHPLVKVDCKWLDPHRIANADEVCRVLKDVPKLQAVVSGHVHQELDVALFAGITKPRMLCSPSTSVQFLPKNDHFAVSQEMPGFRWFILHDDGSFETGVERVSERDLGLDVKAKGY